MKEPENRKNVAEQSMYNVVTLKQFFGPKLDALTNAINSASKSSLWLSISIGILTAIGVFISLLNLWLHYDSENKIRSLSRSQLECVINKASGGGDLIVIAATEYCLKLKIEH